MTGFNEHKGPLPGARVALDEISHEKPPTRRLESVFRRKAKIANQLGTLGGGNHFMEVCIDAHHGLLLIASAKGSILFTIWILNRCR